MNVVAFGEQGHFAKRLQNGTRVELASQALSQSDNMASPSSHRKIRATGSSGRNSLKRGAVRDFLLADSGWPRRKPSRLSDASGRQYRAEFKGDKAKLEWVVSLDGKKMQSETYKVLAVMDKAVMTPLH